MANNIQAISSMKRLIFIDNISNEEAKNISNQHKYVICFSNDDGFETIWKGGKSYSYIRGISENSIKVGSSNIKLNVDQNGILSLLKEGLVKNFYIENVKKSNNEPISKNNDDVYNIYFTDNKFILELKCIGENGQLIYDYEHPNFLFNYGNNLYEISYSKIAGKDEYICEIINKLENVTGNNNNQFTITLEDLEPITCKFNIKYYPKNVTWYNNNGNTTPIQNITLDNNEVVKVLFKLDKTSISELNYGYKLNVYVDNNLDINLSKDVVPGIKNELELKREFFDTSNINHTLELEYTDLNNPNNTLTTKRFTNILNILTPEVQSTDLFYIGNDINAESINPTEIKDNLTELGWHRFEDEPGYYDYNDNPITFTSSWCVIIPQNAHLRVRIYECDDPIDISYSTAIYDDDNYNSATITVNNKQYKKLTIKDTSIRKFINIITKY